MAAQVVCISRTDASLGEEVGTLVAERLSFQYVDEQVIERAARLAQVDPKLVAAVEKRQPLLRGLLDKLAAARDLIQAAIQQIAKDGRAVIVAHAASMTLGAQARVVRVLVTASAETRARRVAAAHGITAAAAAAAVASYDRNRQDYLRRFHNISEELPTHYDVVVNTDVLTAEQATDVIVCAAGARS